MIKKIISTLVVLLVFAAGSVVALQLTRQKSENGEKKVSVIASFYPYYDFAREVGGDKVQVMNMTPAGAEPHDYEPTPKELIAAHDAQLFIYNGGTMEPWVDSFLKDYEHSSVKASQAVTMLQTETNEDHNHSDDHDSHMHEEADPHFWLDPLDAQKIVLAIKDGLVAVDPSNEQYYTTNADAYIKRLAKLNQDFEEGLSRCTLDTVISSHNAFSYLAWRYNFKVESLAGLEPDSEPSPAKMSELTQLVREKGIAYIFFESLVNPRLAETIAQETGAKTLVLDPIEGLTKDEQDKGKNYITIQYDNLANLKTALNCK